MGKKGTRKKNIFYRLFSFETTYPRLQQYVGMSSSQVTAYLG
jgi:hypothetical protein